MTLDIPLQEPKMASSNNTTTGEGARMDEADLARAWADLLKGEKTAEALESNLTNLEKKIDNLLNSFEESERLKVEDTSSKAVEPEVKSEDAAGKKAASRTPTELIQEVGEQSSSSGIKSEGATEESGHAKVGISGTKH